MENKYIEVTGKTVDEALTNALIKLETTSDKVVYEVIDKGSNGFLGLFNSKPAKIKIRKKTAEDDKAAQPKKTEAPKAAPKKVEAEPKKEVKKEVKAEVKTEPKTVKAHTEEKSEMSHEEIERRITTFLSDMFKSMDMDVNVTITFDKKEECVKVDLSGSNMGVLIGKRGQTLDSIQYLTSLVVNKGKEKYVRIKLDTEDYRNRRQETLESLAKNIAYKVKRSRRPVSLEPMNPYERRIIHSALQNDKFVSTKSEGEEPFRHVVVFLDREKNPNHNPKYDKYDRYNK
ncbi:MAG: RNA-binding cell elongation regulator Jag/EloR [Eubacteriales bacterium]|nr:RNA-binding cell elongation regulator Jag/EloR [Eubacteriales bacterium]